MTNVTTYYLEMNSPEALKAKEPVQGFDIIKCQIKQFLFNKFLYTLVGQAWQWTDKLAWSDSEWKDYVLDPQLHTWVAYVKGCPAGYYELLRQEEYQVEIAYFGLAPDFIGQGFGGYLLSHAIRSAWNIPDTKRLWVHTCNLDHQGALHNYQARGFEVYQVVDSVR